MRGIGVSLVVAGTCALVAGSAAASVNARLSAFLTPDRYGASTTVGVRFRLWVPMTRYQPIEGPPEVEEGPAPPLSDFKLLLPAGLGYSSETLGLPVCQPVALADSGPAACPRSARLGTGTLFITETQGGREPPLAAFMGPPHEGHPTILFYKAGAEPVSPEISFSSELAPATGAFGAELYTAFPLIKGSLPEDSSTVQLTFTLGTNRLTLTKHVHHRLVHYHPRGISVPHTCPRGGFPFSAQFTFIDGESTEASTTVPCPN